jgi:subtilase family serine protease/putative cell wall-binding protein
MRFFGSSAASPRRSRVRRVAVATLAAGAALAGYAEGASASVPLPPPVHVGSAAAVPAGAVDKGDVDPSTPLTMIVTLAPRDPVALSAFVSAVSTPGSPEYHQYLRAGEFAGRFGASDATISSVESALSAEGLHPVSVSANHLAITLHDDLKTVSRAMRMAFHNFALPGGRTAYANLTSPLLPASVAPHVEGVIGLDTVARWHRAGALPSGTPAASGSLQPATSSCLASPPGTHPGSYTGAQLATAYGLSALYSAGDTGSGQHIALYELATSGAGYSESTDVNNYEACYGINAPVAYTDVDGGAGTTSGTIEAVLDIEDVVSLAPGASVVVYDGPNSSSGAYDTYANIVSNDTESVISTSWGICEALMTTSERNAESTLFQQAAAQGQTIFAAAGDDGSSDCYSSTGSSALAVDDPASQPYVTGVGGTSLVLGAANQWTSEQVWNSGGGAGGGGISSVWSMPAWQSQAPSSLRVTATQSAKREVPDVSADADPNTGYLIYYTGPDQWSGGWGAIGGTSAAAPLWAAVAALANGSSACSAVGPLGYLNPTLYSSSVAGSYASAFHDVTVGDNSIVGGTKYTAGTAYDMASGLGSPIATGSGTALVSAVCGALVTVTQVTPASATTGTSVTVTGTNFATGTGTTFDFVSSAPGAAIPVQVAASTVNCTSPTSCSVTVPAVSGQVQVVAVVGSERSLQTTAASDTFTVVPTVSGLSVSSGPPGGGTPVTVTGTGFSTATGATSIKFGTAAATAVSCSSTTSCSATSPAGSGTVDVTATVAGQTSAAVAGDQFLYSTAPFVASISPSSGPAIGGDTVTLNGSNLTGATVTVNGSDVGATCSTATQCTYTSPAGSGAEPVVVTTGNGSANTTFTYISPPTVTNVSPSGGPSTGGTSVTVTGTGFSTVPSDTSITFGSAAATGVTCATTTSCTATAPAGSGTVVVSVTVGPSASSVNGSFTYASSGGGGGGGGGGGSGGSVSGGGGGGSTTPTYSRIAGTDADGTAVAELEQRFVPGTNCPGPQPGATSGTGHDVVLATDANYPDALAASYLAGYLGTGILLTPTNTLSTETLNAIAAEGITTVYVVGGPVAVSDAVISQLRATQAMTCGGGSGLTSGGAPVDLQVVQIYGPTLYDTAADIATQFGSSAVGTAAFPGAYGHYDDLSGAASSSGASTGVGAVRTAILATGAGFQDAIAASPMAYAARFPVLLTDPSSLSSQAQAALQSLGIVQVIVTGGPVAVSNTVVGQLQALGIEVLRIAGQDATDTAQQIAQFELNQSNTTGTDGLGWAGRFGATIEVARGDFYADGLAGCVLAGGQYQPLLLTENPNTVGTYLTAFLNGVGAPSPSPAAVSKIVGLGGTGALSDTTLSTMVADIQAG